MPTTTKDIENRMMAMGYSARTNKQKHRDIAKTVKSVQTTNECFSNFEMRKI